MLVSTLMKQSTSQIKSTRSQPLGWPRKSRGATSWPTTLMTRQRRGSGTKPIRAAGRAENSLGLHPSARGVRPSRFVFEGAVGAAAAAEEEDAAEDAAAEGDAVSAPRRRAGRGLLATASG
jgi:hypothetical protein